MPEKQVAAILSFNWVGAREMFAKVAGLGDRPALMKRMTGWGRF